MFDLNPKRLMSKLALAAAMLGAIALPALAQTPQTAPAKPMPPSMATPAKPAVPAPTPAAMPAATPAAPVATGKRVNVNAAAESELASLPGIGPVRSKAIAAGRPYADIKDLVAKKVLTQGVLDGIKDRIALVNINTSTAAELQRSLPGIGDVRSKAIVAARPYAAPADLVSKKVLPQGTFDTIEPLITY